VWPDRPPNKGGEMYRRGEDATGDTEAAPEAARDRNRAQERGGGGERDRRPRPTAPSEPASSSWAGPHIAGLNLLPRVSLICCSCQTVQSMKC